ncbi:hypothetical protein [Pseudomonas shirazensis]|uniref:phage tail tube protein n=1 Tax=Pseudomonas shirazensis TaxID=2745494 RepID=UPI003D290275
MPIGYNSPDNTVGFIGNGPALASLISKSTGKPLGGFFNLGQLSSALMAITADKVEMQDTMSGSLGVAQSKTIKTTVEATFTLKSVSAENVALGAYSSVVKDAAVANKTYTDIAYKGRSIVPDGIISSVTSITAGGEPLVVGEDYVVSNGHIHFYEDGSVEDGTEVTVTYATVSTKRLEALIDSDIELCIVFDGMNVAKGKAPVKVTIYNVSLSPMAQRQLIGTDFGELELKGTVQLAKHITGAGLSRYYKEEHADIV